MPGLEVFDNNEREHIIDVLDSGIIMRYNFDDKRNGHWKAKELEEAIQNKFNVRHAHLTSSGTTALITAFRALGIGAGDEIIMPPFTFVASFEAVLFAGAIPIFADIDDTLTLSPEAVEKAITPRTKAVMPVHMCGAMADMDALMAITKKHNLFLIEDACQAIGATYKGKYLGTIGDIGCYSFDFVKTVTCGEGGAVVTNNDKFYEISDQYSDHGHDHIGNNRGLEGHPITGLNFRISELHAAIGLAQWPKLDSIIAHQRKIKSEMISVLSQNSKIKFRRIPDKEGDNASFLSIFLKSPEVAEAVSKELAEAGIPCAYWFNNNWHYIRGWEHFMNLKENTLLYKEQRDLLPDYAAQNFSASNEVMGRVISFPLSLKTTVEKARENAELISKIVSEQNINV